MMVPICHCRERQLLAECSSADMKRDQSDLDKLNVNVMKNRARLTARNQNPAPTGDLRAAAAPSRTKAGRAGARYASWFSLISSETTNPTAAGLRLPPSQDSH